MAKGDSWSEPWVVKQSGGDYATLNACVSNASTGSGDYIEIQGTWTIDDTTVVTLDETNLNIRCDSDSKHPGYLIEETRSGSTTHYRHYTSGASDNITVTASGSTIEGIAILSASTTDSQEAIDYQNGDITVKSCIIHSTNAQTQKDGLYTGDTGRTLTIHNSIITDWARGGIHIQNDTAGTGTHTVNMDSCTVYGCGADNGGGGIYCQITDCTINLNLDNSLLLENDAGGANSGDISMFGASAAATWTINYCTDSDNSLATYLDAGGNNQASKTSSAAAPSSSFDIFFQSITSPYNFTLQGSVTHNDAQNTGATTLTEDIIGTARDGTDDRGAFEYTAGGGSSIAPLAANHLMNMMRG